MFQVGSRINSTWAFNLKAETPPAHPRVSIYKDLKMLRTVCTFVSATHIQGVLLTINARVPENPQGAFELVGQYKQKERRGKQP